MAVPVQDGTVAAVSGFPQPQINLSTSHTINAGLTDSILVIFVTAATQPPAAAFWNGVQMPGFSWATANFYGAGFFLKNPASGTHTAEAFWNVFAVGTSMACVTFTGTSGVSFQGTTASGFSSLATIDFLTYGAESLALSMTTSTNSGAGFPHTEGTGQTQTSDINAGHIVGQPEQYRVSTSYKTAADPGTNTTMSTTLHTDYDWQIFTLFLNSATRHGVPQEMIL